MLGEAYFWIEAAASLAIRSDKVVARRTNDPLGITDTPNIVQDPARQQEIAAEVIRKLNYVRQSLIAGRATFGEPNEFNRALIKLKREVERGENRGVIPTQAELGFAVWYRSKLAAVERGAEARSPEDIARGRLEAASLLSVRKHRPYDRILYIHVKAAMAIIQEATGRPVHATRAKNGDYQPQTSDRLSRTVVDLIQAADPKIPTTKIVNFILKARSAFRGKPMRLEMFCPGYGMKVTPF